MYMISWMKEYKKSCQQALLSIFNDLLQISWKRRQIKFQCRTVSTKQNVVRVALYFQVQKVTFEYVELKKIENLNILLHVLEK
jgi:hypothetical protein